MTDIKTISLEDLRERMNEATDGELIVIEGYLRQVLHHRRNIREHRVAQDLSVGCSVRFIGGRPKYLQGKTGRLVAFRQTKVLIQLDCGPIGKFRNGQVVAPISLLEVIR